MSGPLSNRERLKQLLSKISQDDSIAILINPDPDAIASACALSRLLWKRVKKVGIFMVSAIKRPDNQAMVRLLRIHLRPLKELKEVEYNKFALVDNQPSHHEGFGMRRYSLLIDHHPKVPETLADYIDIRPDYGANSTIMYEYLKAAKIKPSKRLATALFFGIMTDTKNLIADANERDIMAFKELASLADMSILKKIQSSELTRKSLLTFKKAFQNMKFLKNKLFVFMGQTKNADDLVLIADFFVKVTDVDWAFVAGIVGQRLVVVIRYFGSRGDAGSKAKALFEPLGASAGGHKSAARAEIGLTALEQHLRPRQEIEAFLTKLLKEGRPPKG